MKQLPDNFTKYKTTPEFTELTVPKGLLRDHKTKEGVWGVIVVLQGELEYTICEPTIETTILNAATTGVVEQQILHHIKPLGQVRFHVEFYREGVS